MPRRKLLGTVRRKLAALVGFTALAAFIILPLLWWLMHRELIDEVDDRVPEAIHGFDEELADDLKDLDVTAIALSEQGDTERAIAGADVAALLRIARPFRDAYPDLDILFYAHQAAGAKLVAQIGCAHARATLPPGLGPRHSLLAHGCEDDPHAPVALTVQREVGTAGVIVVCLPLDQSYFKNMQAKLGIELAFQLGTSLELATSKFPVAHIAEATPEGMIDDDSDQTWALAWFVPELLGTAEGGLAPRMTAALDVSDIEAIVRKHLLIALAIVSFSTVLSLAIGWRLASRMSRALSRVNYAIRRLEDQEYVKVEAVKTGDELEDLAEGFNQMVDGLRERDKLRTTMGKYMTAEVMAHVMAGEVELGGKTLEVTILFCDLRDFTTLSEKRSAQEIVGLLNEYFTVMVDVVMEQGGVVDKYIGDNIMAVFGAPVSRPDDAIRAVRASVKMRAALATLNSELAHRGVPALRFGIGMHSGEVVAGNIGSARRMEYTVIGDAVNVASRLESKTKEIGTDILISDATRARTNHEIETELIGEIHVKGREEPVKIYKVG